MLQQLQVRLERDATGTDKVMDRLRRLEGLLAQKAHERTRVVELYRRGRINEAVVDEQMGEIGREEGALELQIDELRVGVTSIESVRTTVGSAETLLMKLRQRLEGPVSWQCKRELIEVLIAGVCVDTIDDDGVRQNKITVSYRFSEPGEPAGLVLPQAYSIGAVVRIPVEPKTVGDHIRKKRFSLKLLQRQVAETLGVDKACIYNWESNRSKPAVRHMPAIARFLGYDPLPEPESWAERLIHFRTSLGLKQRDFADRLGVDPCTLARWERGEREPTGSFEASVIRVLTASEGDRPVKQRPTIA